MRELTLVTGNKSKAGAWRRVMPASVKLSIVELELTEIQFETDHADIVRHKVREAYSQLQKPVLVEDVSAGLDAWNGLPGPYIKAFVKQLGAGAFYELAGRQEVAVTATCRVAYFDGVHEILAEGSVKGTGVQPRGDNDFGFGPGFQPDGYKQTFGEMTSEQRDPLTHRTLAINNILELLGELN